MVVLILLASSSGHAVTLEGEARRRKGGVVYSVIQRACWAGCVEIIAHGE